MFLEILIFLVGIVMLIMGANVMVDSASTLAQKFKNTEYSNRFDNSINGRSNAGTHS